MNPRREQAALREIVQAIDTINVYVKALSVSPDMGIDAIKYQLVVIGEAVSRVSEQTRAHAPEIPWERIKSQRNVLVHAYDDVDLPRIRTVLDRHLDPLRFAVEALLTQSDPLSDPGPNVIGQEGGGHETADTSTSTGSPGHLPGVGEDPVPGSSGGGAGPA